nr:E3 ubiquitin-protein ligase TRIM33-like [Lytechinus pictus]
MADAMNAISQSMECPVCLSTFTDPKILSCSHTFCKTCLDNLLECHGNCQIRCPVCRAVTQVPNQDVGKLQANLVLKNLIEDMKCHTQICTNCKSNDKPSAVVYCQDCGKYLCTSCLNMHSQWGDFIGHDVIAMSEISSGNVSVRRYRKCRKHPKEDDGCFCSTCRRFTCFRCVVMEHTGEGHTVIEGAAYEDKHMKSIEELKSKVDTKESCFQKYIDFIDEQMKSVDNTKKQCTSDINKAYDEAVQQLAEKREILLREVKGMTEGVEKELENLKTLVQRHINQLTTIAEMVTNRTKIPVDMDTLAAHDTLCEELRELFDQENPDYEKPRKSSSRGKSVSFERNVGKDELGLGKIVNEVVQNVALPTVNSMDTMVSTSDGRMAVGCYTGGMNIFSADGQLQQTVLEDVKIRGVGFLSNGQCVVIDTSNEITLYTPEYTKLNVKFVTLSMGRGGISKLTVDCDDLIYVSYWKAKEIQVFSTAGGQAVSEIPCNGYEPWQITSYDGSLITSSDDTIRLIDKEGVVQHKLKKRGCDLYAAVSQGNTILIGKVKHDEGLVSIDEYTNELRHIRNLVNDYKIEKSKRKWYYLKQYRSEEIAFCTPDRLYIFH